MMAMARELIEGGVWRIWCLENLVVGCELIVEF